MNWKFVIFFIITLTILFYIFTTNKNNDQNSQRTPASTYRCNLAYAPVCGSNGETFTNSCFAEMNNVFDYTPGKCDSGNQQ